MDAAVIETDFTSGPIRDTGEPLGRRPRPMSLTFGSSRFGTLTVDASAVIEFPAGLIGLGGLRYALIASAADAPFAWLHSVDDPDVALPVTNPWLHYGDYTVDLSEADAARVGSDDPAEVDVWVTVRTGTDPADFSCNLRAPIVVRKGRGHQVINEAPGAPVRAPLFPKAGWRGRPSRSRR